jgi:hypothetical protein
LIATLYTVMLILLIADIVRAPPSIRNRQVQEMSKDSSSEFAESLANAAIDPAKGIASEWRYRGRSASEMDVNEPLQAPPSLGAQKDEGFQKFYKAVVSPTHVRVTAGGRIVPNTRGPQSPTAKWSKEKPATEGNNISRPTSQVQFEPVPFPFAQPGMPMMPAMYPSVAPGMAPFPAQMPYMQYPIGYNMQPGLPMPTPVGGHVAFHSIASDPHGIDILGGDGQKNGKEKSNQIRISPPEQFDHSRPFMFNGQMVNPSPITPFFPMGMMGFPASVYGQPSVGMNQMVPPGAYLSNQIPPMPLPMFTGAAGLQAPGEPPPSSIKKSDITKKQLDVLRISLKKCEDQLQYNRHQIDEKDMENQAHVIRANIKMFEDKLKTELAMEKASSKGAAQVRETKDASSTRKPEASANSSISETKHDSTVPILGPQASIQKVAKPVTQKAKKEAPKPRDSVKAHKAAAPLHIPSLDPDLVSVNDSRKKPSALPSTAALAAPFQPGMDVTTGTPADKVRESSTISKPLTSTKEAIEAEQKQIAVKSAHGDRLGTHEATRLVHILDNREAAKRAARERESWGEPYLVGMVPPGVRAEDVEPKGYVYNRSLTSDEEVAWHLFASPCSEEARQNYPRFDGRDFYPAHQVKPEPPKAAKPEPPSDANSLLQLLQRVGNSHRPRPSALVSKTESNGPSKHGAKDADPFSTSEHPKSGFVGQLHSTGQLQSRVNKEAPKITLRSPTAKSGFVKYQSEDLRKSTSTPSDAVKSDGSRPSSDTDEEHFPKWEGRQGIRARQVQAQQAKALAQQQALARIAASIPDNLTTISTKSNDLFHSMRKNGTASGNALPGAVTSTTAHGLLPQYAGHAAASLTPAMTVSSIAASRAPLSKAGEHAEVTSISSPQKVGENLPPSAILASAENSSTAREQPAKSTRQDHHHQHGFARSWGA